MVWIVGHVLPLITLLIVEREIPVRSSAPRRVSTSTFFLSRIAIPAASFTSGAASGGRFLGHIPSGTQSAGGGRRVGATRHKVSSSE